MPAGKTAPCNRMKGKCILLIIISAEVRIKEEKFLILKRRKTCGKTLSGVSQKEETFLC